MTYTASSNTIIFNPDAGGYVEIDAPIVHNTYTACSSSSDEQTMISSNDI